MANMSLQIVLCSCFIVLACNNREDLLEGTFANKVPVSDHQSSQATDTVIHNLSFFKNGYWIHTCFMDGYVFDRSGGTYKKIKDKYLRTFNFDSEDSALPGKTDTFTYSVKGNQHLLKGFHATNTEQRFHKEVYQKIALPQGAHNRFLEGVWMMQAGQAGFTTNADEVIRIFAYPSFIRIFYNSKDGNVYHVDGGQYEFDGNDIREIIQYTTADMAWGAYVYWNVKRLSPNRILLYDIDSHYDEEIYEKSEQPQ
jgi:hypothetical protein